MMRHARIIPALVFALFLATPAHATRTFVSGWDTCDEQEFDDGGTTANTTISTTKRTGRCALQVATTAGVTAYHERDLAPAVLDVYARVYLRPVVTPDAGLSVFGFWQASTGGYGCRLDLEADNSLALRFKNRAAYVVLGQTGSDTVAVGTWSGIELHQQNNSGATCTGNCQVICDLWVDGNKVISVASDNIAGADYGSVTNVEVGVRGTDGGAATVLFDDLVLDDNAQIGVGRVVPLTPDGDGTPNQWNNTCSGSKANCLDDYASAAPATDDGHTTDLRETTSGNKTTVTLTTETLAAGETLASVSSFGIAREVTDDARDWRLNQTDGDGGSDGSPTTTGTTSSPGPNYVLSSRMVSAVKPGGGAWTQAALDSLTLQLEHRANTGNIDVTALLAYAEVQTSPPAIPQNLQDWDADDRITVALLGDSITQGTGIGFCQGDASVQCSSNLDCQPPSTASDVSPCANTAKYPTAFAARLIQKIGSKATTVLNCGINGNDSLDMIARVPNILSGVATRYCGNVMPRTCTPDSGTCTATNCASAGCAPQGNGSAACAASCSLVLGSRVCSLLRSKDCVSDTDCTTGQGTCSGLPGADYVTTLVGVNDTHANDDPNCLSGPDANQPPCPPHVATTPIATPTPGAPYQCQRVTCNNTTECRTGRCSNNLSKACDTNGDCSGGGTCSAALLLGTGFESCTTGTCVADPTRVCRVDSDCVGTDICSPTSKICTCSCFRIPCTTDADCGGAQPLSAADGREWSGVRITGTCSGGFCSQCGPPACPGETNYQAVNDARSSVPKGPLLKNFRTLSDLVAAQGRRMVWLTHTAIFQVCGVISWGGSLKSLMDARQWQLTQSNTVDIWLHHKQADAVIANKRCSTDATRICTANADCSGTGAQCVVYPSILRPQTDGAHLNPLGASVVATKLADYLTKLSPVCSLDPSIGCGRCSITTSQACIDSSSCPAYSTSGEKCLATTSVCSGLSKGTCSLERACNSATSCTTHKLCTLSLARCTADGDCGATGGVCRDEGLLQPGEG